MLMVVGSAVADELLGTLTKVDASAMKLTVVDQDQKEVEVTVTVDTDWATAKGESKIKLKRVERGLEKAKEKGRPGIRVTVTHEKGVASKITVGKKKAEDKSQD